MSLRLNSSKHKHFIRTELSALCSVNLEIACFSSRPSQHFCNVRNVMYTSRFLFCFVLFLPKVYKNKFLFTSIYISGFRNISQWLKVTHNRKGFISFNDGNSFEINFQPWLKPQMTVYCKKQNK